MTRRRKIIKRFLWSFFLLFLIMNFVAFFHAYKFTHFSENSIKKSDESAKLSMFGKLKTLAFGINNPRPKNDYYPKQKYTTFTLNSNKKIEYWSIKTAKPKGTIILFHGYGGQKASMLDKSDVFLKLGFNTMLVDFMGSGGSEGNQTTIGYLEAEQVKSCYEYLLLNGKKNIYLMGTSLGAVAIMKALDDYQLKPKGIILECPFGTMYKTVCARFKTMGAPTFPMAGLLVFWGGVQNGFWAFGHNPSEYAKNIHCPTLLLYGEKDPKVSRSEIDEIFLNLKGEKQLKTYSKSGHENYLLKYQSKWTKDIITFLQ